MGNVIKKFSLFVAGVIALLLVSVGFNPQTSASNHTAQDAVCAGLGAASGSDGCTQPEDEGTVDNILTTVINIISLIGAVIAIIMIIIGGLRYITSSGDSGSTTGARNTIIYAVVGLVIIALAQIIVQFVIERAAPTNDSREDSGYFINVDLG